MNEHVNDEFVKKAKLYNYRSRAAFKLIEINHRYNLLKPGYKVIDLGAAPGGWTQVAVEKVNSAPNKPIVFSIDRDAMAAVPGSVYYRGDIEDELTRIKIKEFLNYNNADVILSDMAPNFVGDKDIDHMNITVLNGITLKVCFHSLRTGGSVLMKSLNGTLENKFFTYFKTFFKTFQRIKPSASRARSSELFYLGTGFKLNEDYQKFITLKEKMAKNQPISKSDYPSYGMDMDHLKTFFGNMVEKSSELGISMPPEFLKEMEGFGLNVDDFQPDPEKKNRLKDAEEEQIIRDVIDKESGINFSFTRKVPQTLKEMFEMQDKKAKEFEVLFEKKTKEDADDSLFEPEEEEDKNMKFEKMDSLADIDELSPHLFEDEMADNQHLNDLRKEHKEYLKQLREDNRDFDVKLREARKDPRKFAELMDEDPDAVIDEYIKDEKMRMAAEDAEELEKRLHFEEQKDLKDRAKVLRQRRQEMKNFHKKNVSFDD